MRAAVRPALGLTACLVLAACGRGDDTEEPAPTTTATTPAAATASTQDDETPAVTPRHAADLHAWLRATYGPDARLTQAWTDPDGRARRVCARGGPPDAEAWPSLLAVCADAPGCFGTGDGAVDFFALARSDSGVRAAASAREVASGANGCAGAVAIARFGRERWGFVHHGGTTSQGYVIGWTWLRTFRAGRLEALAAVNTVFDNNGAACEADDCREVGISINGDVRFDASDPQADAWPLVVHQSGVECFLNVDRTRRYAFDAARFRYPVPDGPPDVVCPPVAPD
jgi:hypothetical protein